jgi:hypothetical protein
MARRRLARAALARSCRSRGHVGTFTTEGTFRAAIDKLDHLVASGITALELMPVADFAGRRNWGYDGVLWYAPTAPMAGPSISKRWWTPHTNAA